MEQVLYDENGVKVTNARFVYGGKTSALSGITSVSMTYTSPSRVLPIILIIIGIVCFFVGSIVAGIVCCVLGGVWLYFQKNTYHVVLESASGSANALSSKDETMISEIVEALNQAIVARG